MCRLQYIISQSHVSPKKHSHVGDFFFFFFLRINGVIMFGVGVPFFYFICSIDTTK